MYDLFKLQNITLLYRTLRVYHRTNIPTLSMSFTVVLNTIFPAICVLITILFCLYIIRIMHILL